VKPLADSKYRIYFKVRGSGHFPVAMLRLEKAVFGDNESALLSKEVNERELTIQIYSLKRERKPRKEWTSYGWKVIKESIRPVEIE